MHGRDNLKSPGALIGWFALAGLVLAALLLL
jgi:hypothetical protein